MVAKPKKDAEYCQKHFAEHSKEGKVARETSPLYSELLKPQNTMDL